MTRKRRRLLWLIVGMAFLGSATALVLIAFEDSLVFFYSPSEAMVKPLSPERRFRLGGLVEPDSVKRLPDGITIDFRVTDGQSSIPVTYSGILPDLFREGQGVVAEGNLTGGVFHAKTVLAKHDEKYMPPEVAEALKRSGQWHPSEKP
jgi:cytochrome c-type biogenesis protein CcmE